MSDEQPEPRGEDETPVPRDLPDQQASDEEDHWDLDDDATTTGDGPDEDGPDDDVPDTDEAGTGPRGAPHADSEQHDQPVPDEPSG